jgi:hypothetical protein
MKQEYDNNQNTVGVGIVVVRVELTFVLMTQSQK